MVLTTLKIDGMACGMCESHVNDCIRDHFTVEKVSSSYKKGVTEIISEEQLSEKDLREALDPTGYRVLSVSSQPYEKKGFRLFGRK